jgi:hypothetical protein
MRICNALTQYNGGYDGGPLIVGWRGIMPLNSGANI